MSKKISAADQTTKISPGTPIEDVYNHWAPGEPNNTDGQEGCVILTKEGKLNDERCDRKYPFICKKAFAEFEWNSDCDMPNRGTFLPFNTYANIG